MNNIINVAFQILPKSDSNNTYAIIDKVIEVIQNSGLKFKVCPFETVIEGKYDDVMLLIKQAQQTCFDAGATEFIANIKMQVNKTKDVKIKDKMYKYES